ncbi:MAG: glutamate racemase [Paucibacter sp.]|nr:glutamate racemase [Roseateles sp.]
MNALPSESIACKPPFIGVFDSGVGGLTVLRALRHLMPDVPLQYVADTANAPYGERDSDFIAARSLAIAQHLVQQGAALLVVACNTATAHAVEALRRTWPELPVVGIEPGIKPAVAASRNGRVGVMATTATLTSARYQELLKAHAGPAHIVGQACTGLAHGIESAQLDAPELDRLLARHCAALIDAGVDTVLLGCTHYPLVQDRIARHLGPDVQLLNIEDAVARQAQRCWQALAFEPEAAPGSPASIELESTGDPAPLTRLAQQALHWPVQARQVLI